MEHHNRYARLTRGYKSLILLIKLMVQTRHFLKSKHISFSFKNLLYVSY